eukprot:3719732-Pleurochrysis_carterae.AAC.1
MPPRPLACFAQPLFCPSPSRFLPSASANIHARMPGIGDGEFYVCDLISRAEPRAITQGAGSCGNLRLAADGSGVVYLASHSTALSTSATPSSSSSSSQGAALALWWVPWDGATPPAQVSPPGVQIADFGWAPSASVPEPSRNSGSSDREGASRPSADDLAASLRLWVTVVRGARACTWLIDLASSITAQFDLPVLGEAVTWVPEAGSDGDGVQWRCLYATETVDRPLSLWHAGAQSL